MEPAPLSLQEKNRRLLLTIFGVVVGMICLAFASVPLYNALCKVTGWGGKTRVAVQAPGKVYDRSFTVQFNADTNPDLPWRFTPDQHKISVKLGQSALVSYSATNLSQTTHTGTAVYNVTPLKAGKYFNKTQCFCFSEQTLHPHETAHFPVTFFIDPKIMDDRELKDLKTITLSYTFYRHDSQALEKAVKKFYN